MQQVDLSLIRTGPASSIFKLDNEFRQEVEKKHKKKKIEKKTKRLVNLEKEVESTKKRIREINE